MNAPPMRWEYEGQPCPDQFDDPIGYHLWHEAHRCPECNGVGYTWTTCDCDCGMCGHEVAIDCEDCEGTGYLNPDMFDPDF